MLAFSPPLFSTMGWLLEEDNYSLNLNLNNNQNYFNKDVTVSSSNNYSFSHHHQFSSQAKIIEVENSTSLPSHDPSMEKKLNHNANERDRRKKINALVSSLRSLLPMQYQTRKMSIPVTISRVLNYIPELQGQVEALTKKKEELLSRISHQGNNNATKKESERKIISNHNNSVFVVSTSRINDTEAVIQISSYEFNKTPLSNILFCLEHNGFFLLNASSSETFAGRVFYNLHFKVEKTERLESEIIAEKLLSIFEKKQRNFK